MCDNVDMSNWLLNGKIRKEKQNKNGRRLIKFDFKGCSFQCLSVTFPVPLLQPAEDAVSSVLENDDIDWPEIQ